jgi:hypothetical protein
MKWKDVPDYEGIYEVSNTGLIRTWEHKVTHTELHGERTWNQRILKYRIGRDGSCRVNLWKDGKPKTHAVHRIVALAFLDKPEGKKFIKHKDGNKTNNSSGNLEWSHTKKPLKNKGVENSGRKEKLVNS